MSEPLFIPFPFFSFRSPILSTEVYQKILEEDDWISAAFNFFDTHEGIRESIALASPSLYHSLHRRTTKNRDKIATSLLKYIVRMATRATPFGCCSFVGKGAWKDKTMLSIDPTQLFKRARPDMEWLSIFIDSLYANKSLFSSLPVHANSLISLKNDRFFLSFIRMRKKSLPNNTTKTISIRATPLIKEIIKIASNPIPINTLCQKVLNKLPNLELEKIKSLILNLLLQQTLLPSLMPSLLNPSYFEDLLSTLPRSVDLSRIKNEIDAYQRLPPGHGEKKLTTLQSEMQKIAPAKTPLHVDTFYQGPLLYLPKNIANELGKAAEILWKITARRGFLSSIHSYHERFLNRYGTTRTLPLLDVLSEETGLGPLENPYTHKTEPPLSNFEKIWERWLRREWQECLLEKRKEIVLTESRIDHLFSLAKEEPPNPQEALPSFDLFFKIIAESKDTIDQGEALIHLFSHTFEGGSAIGRFLDGLRMDTDDFSMRDLLKSEEILEPGTHFIELSYLPPIASSANVAIHPCHRTMRLDLDETKKTPYTLTLNDIYVGATSERLYLTLKEGKHEIIARVGNLLNINYAPAPLHFMRQVSHAKYRLLSEFPWGDIIKEATFLPRVRFNKTILFAAQWSVSTSTCLKNPQEFSSWANQWDVPRYFYLTLADQALLIDRHHPAHLRELHLKLRKGETLILNEAIETQHQCAQNRYKKCHTYEIVAPFRKNKIYKSKPAISPPAYQPVPLKERCKLPGSEWIYIAIYMKKERETSFLLHDFSPFIGRLLNDGVVEQWFFIRYGDPQPHLRIRLKLHQIDFLNSTLKLLQKFAQKWMEMKIINSLSLPIYEREIERYGGMHCIDKAEKLFFLDSQATLHILNGFKQSKLPSSVMHTLSAFCFLQGFGLCHKEISNFLTSLQKRNNKLKGFRIIQVELLNSLRMLKECKLENDETILLNNIQKFQSPHQKDFYNQCKSTSFQRDSIINSLLHMHFNRLGCDPEEESKSRTYLYHALNKLHISANLQSTFRT